MPPLHSTSSIATQLVSCGRRRLFFVCCLQVYDRVAIRLVFPGRERLILQANFAPSESARAVAAVLRGALRGGDACADRIELYTTPPRTVLDLESDCSLLDLGFAPAARINVSESTIVRLAAAGDGTGNGSFGYLSAPLRAQAEALRATCPDAVAAAAAAMVVPCALRLTATAAATKQSLSRGSGGGGGDGDGGSAAPRPGPAAKKPRRQGGGSKKVPSWFKT